VSDIWYNKLKSYVPQWVFDKKPEAEPIFRGLSVVFQQLQDDYELNLAEAFIDTATEEYLEQIGAERGIERFDGESLGAYRLRVKEIKNRSNCPAIKDLVDTLLINGQSTIIEHSDADQFFLSRASYLNRGLVPTDLLYNAFTVIVPSQIPEAELFTSRESFLNREETLGTSESSFELFRQIVQAINENKAFGVVYRLFEQAS
jgi:hypothetical protein